MEASDELRSALEGRQAADDAKARKRQALDREREGFEREEEAVRTRLREAIDLAVQALPKAEAQPEELPISPPPAPTGLMRFFERQQFAVGWKVSLDNRGDQVLCPDGTLITPQHRAAGPGPFRSDLRTSLHALVDAKLRTVHLDTPAGIEIQMNYFTEAFGNGPLQGEDRAIQELRNRLSGARDGTMAILADLLHRVGVPAI